MADQSNQTTGNRTVCVFGLGYVGCVTAVGLAHLGHSVIGVDRDAFKVQSISDGIAPFREPELDAMLRSAVASGALTATTSAEEGLRQAEVALVCVGTPSEGNGDINLEQLRRVFLDVARTPRQTDSSLILTVRSTAFPGSCEQLADFCFPSRSDILVTCNPEFLREGKAIADFMNPSLLVVGGDSREAVQTVADLYRSLDVVPTLVSLRTAEMIKYVCNAFHAVKIAFANEVGAISASQGIDPEQVMDVVCRDTKLNVSSAYLRPGLAFGGSCLPKDLRALNYRATRADLSLPLIKSILPSNDEHLKRSIHLALAIADEPIGIYGITFKEDTDDIRESPTTALIEALIGKGRELVIYDPNVDLKGIYGSNLNFLLSTVPHIRKLLVSEFDDVLSRAKHLILTQTPPEEIRKAIAASGIPVLDLRKVNPIAALAGVQARV